MTYDPRDQSPEAMAAWTRQIEAKIAAALAAEQDRQIVEAWRAEQAAARTARMERRE